MTVRESASGGESTNVAPVTTAAVEYADAGDLEPAIHNTLRVDQIALSRHASALIAAGLAVRALLIKGFEEIQKRIALPNGRSLVLESGIYSLR